MHRGFRRGGEGMNNEKEKLLKEISECKEAIAERIGIYGMNAIERLITAHIALEQISKEES
jgi:hypothetical protein